MLTIVFYTNNGAAAKLRSREIAAVKGNYARVYDAAVWDGSPDKCDAVEIMSDVPGWQRKRIVQVFGEPIEIEHCEVEHELVRTNMGLMPPKEPASEEPKAGSLEKKAVHKGGGRWFVMTGEERLSGPHDKAEALRIAGEA